MEWEDILRKLRYREGLKSRFINVPQYIQNELEKLDLESSEDESTKYQFTVLFAKNKADVDRLAKSTIDNTEFDSIFWISYPKGGASIKTDINRNKLWELMKPYGYRPVSQVSIDNEWSAMRFRPSERMKSK